MIVDTTVLGEAEMSIEILGLTVKPNFAIGYILLDLVHPVTARKLLIKPAAATMLQAAHLRTRIVHSAYLVSVLYK